jgi:hypothetical protein
MLQRRSQISSGLERNNKIKKAAAAAFYEKTGWD